MFQKKREITTTRRRRRMRIGDMGVIKRKSQENKGKVKT